MATPRRTRPMRYEFLVDGNLTERALAAFPEFTVSSSSHAYTALYGPVGSETQLRGILGRFDTLGLLVVEMRRLPD